MGEGQEVRVTHRYVTVYFDHCTEPKGVTLWMGGGKKIEILALRNLWTLPKSETLLVPPNLIFSFDAL